jgi:ribosomal protein S18 acetylase RimI-like enzyme
MSEEYEVRTYLKPGDIGSITYLHGILYAKEYGWNHTFEAYVAGPLSDFARLKNPDERIWIVEVSDKVCGSIALTQVDNFHAQLRWFLLDPCLRGKGIGKKLMTLLLNYAEEKGYQSIDLWTVKRLEVAIVLYQKFGFNLVKEHTRNIWGTTVIEQKYMVHL